MRVRPSKVVPFRERIPEIVQPPPRRLHSSSPDPGPYGRHQILGAGAEAGGHGLDSPGRRCRATVPRHPACTAATARLPRVHQENRDAIGRAHGEPSAGDIRHECIPLAEAARRSPGVQANIGMDLLEAGQVRPLVPGQRTGWCRNRAPATRVPAGEEPGRPAGSSFWKSATTPAYAAGFWTCAIRICCLKSSSIDSSRRTSVGRLARVVILSILSWSFNRP